MNFILKFSSATILAASLLTSCNKSAKVEKKLGPAETITHLTESVTKGDANAAWESLPKSYRADINDIAHVIGEKMPANIWDETFTLVGRIGKVLETKKGIFLELMGNDLPSNVSKADVEKSISSLGKIFSLLAKSDLAKVDSLKKIDLGKVADSTGTEILNLVMANDLINSLVSDSGKTDAKTLAGAIGKIKATLVSETENTAKIKITDPEGKVEEVEMVKVEDKWIAKKMAEEFKSGIKEAKEQLEKSLAELPKQQAGIMMGLGMAGGIVTTLENAKSAEDVKKAFDSLNLNPSMVVGALSMFGNNQTSSKANEAREMSHLKMIGSYIAFHFADGTSSELTGDFSQFKNMEEITFDISKYVILYKKGDSFSGAADIVMVSEKPDPSKDGAFAVFQDGHVAKILGNFKTVDDIKKAAVAQGFKLK